MRLFYLYIFLGVFLLPSCKEEVTEVSFRMKAEGFDLERDPDPDGKFGNFSQMLDGGLITFEGENQNYIFDLRGARIEDHLFRLPAGEYRVSVLNGPASIYGQPYASFTMLPFSVQIDQQTDTIMMEVEADCALALVLDETDQLEYGAFMIERHSFAHGFFDSYPFLFNDQSELYYTYFRPDTVPDDPSAFIWFYEGKPGLIDGGIPTFDMQIGHQYHIRILE